MQFWFKTYKTFNLKAYTIEGLLNENNLNLEHINPSLLQLGHTGNRRFDYVFYLDLYLINHTQAVWLYPPAPG